MSQMRLTSSDISANAPTTKTSASSTTRCGPTVRGSGRASTAIFEGVLLVLHEEQMQRLLWDTLGGP